MFTIYITAHTQALRQKWVAAFCNVLTLQCGGVSVFTGEGWYLADNGEIITEPSVQISTVCNNPQAVNDSLAELIAAYKLECNQESVLTVLTIGAEPIFS